MMKNIIYLSFILLLNSCVVLDTGLTPIPQSTKEIDIPHYDNGKPYVYWHYAKHKEPQLNISSPEKSTDSLLFRIWVTNPVGHYNQPHALIELKYDTAWHGKMILMKVNFSRWNFIEKITNTKTFKLVPKTNWDNVIDSLYKLKIDKLPTDEAIPNYYNESNRYTGNSTTFSFEYSTKTIYRFYQYGNIYRDPKHYWQPRHIIDLFGYLEDEFNWDSIAREYFK